MSTPKKSASRREGATGKRGDGEIGGSDAAATRRRGDAAKSVERVEVINRQRMRAIDQLAAAALSRRVLEKIGRADAELTIAFIRDRQMRRLNQDYRGLDKPTDVLSFSYHESEDQHDESNHLGDVVISVETAERYADDLGLSFQCEIEHLIIHGTLHLAGFDHETDNGEMNRLERKLRKELLKK